MTGDIEFPLKPTSGSLTSILQISLPTPSLASSPLSYRRSSNATERLI